MPRSANAVRTGQLLVDIGDYAKHYHVESPAAFEAARLVLLDALASALQALNVPQCRQLLGPIVPGATMNGGARVPGTSYELDPAQAAFNIGAMIRWADRDDAWLAAASGHPSDNLGAILAVSDYLSRQAILYGRDPLTVRDVLTALIKAHEIQAVLAPQPLVEGVGCGDLAAAHLASTAIVTAMLGGTPEQVIDAALAARLESGRWRSDRHASTAGSHGAWDAGDAASAAVRDAFRTLRAGVQPSGMALEGEPFSPSRPLGASQMEGALATRPQDVSGRIEARFRAAVRKHFPDKRAAAIEALCAPPARLDDMSVSEFVAAFVTNG